PYLATPLLRGALLGALLVASAAAAQEPPDEAGTVATYQTPAQVLVDMVDAPPTPEVRLSPDREWLLVLERPSLPPIEELARRELRLAGLRIDPGTHGRSRTYALSGLSLVRVADGEERAIQGLPAEPRIERPAFSPDGARIAFTHTREDGIELWLADVATGQARRLTSAPLNLAVASGPVWLPDSSGLLVPLVPEGLGPEPAEPEVPTGPVIQESSGRKAPARTYQDLLQDPYDEALFEHYTAARLARVGLDGTVTPLAGPGLLGGFDPSPDGRFVLVEWLHRPFSYLVPFWRFPRRIEVRDAAGGLVQELADLPLQDEVPIAFGSVPTGPREHQWRADVPATVVWTEALDGGDAAAEAEERDRLFALEAPFGGEARPLATLALRYGGVQWGRDDLALVSEWWWPTRRQRSWRVRPGEPEAAAELVFDHSWEDRYNDPGAPVTEPDERGRPVLVTGGEGETLYLIGAGASPEGDRPFLDAFDLASGATERLFRSESPYYELPQGLLGPAGPGAD
ncbi:MAG TPA: S9 family peptidase, partial [Thermoanaerobaculia bacterium]|nr:S9 family peptidase [Thermoanaerobaculia bacterium]